MWRLLKELNINFYLIIIFVLLTLAGCTYYFQRVAIPKAEKAVLAQTDVDFMEKQVVAVIKKDSEITKYTQITEDVIEKNIEFKDIPVMFSAKDTVSSKEELINKYAREVFSPGEQIIKSALAEEAKLYGDYDRLKEYTISNLVADKAGKGAVVDVVVNYGNGDYDVVLVKRKIVDVIVDAKANKQTYTMVFEVNEIDYRDLELAKQLGGLEIRLYIDESQPESEKTFDYNSAVNKLQISTTNKTQANVSANKEEFFNG